MQGGRELRCGECGGTFSSFQGAYDFLGADQTEPPPEGSTIRRATEAAAANPHVYDAIQAAAGRALFQRRLRSALVRTSGDVVLDVGAGTGELLDVVPDDAIYLWLDVDRQKLEGYRRRADGPALLADATRIPLVDASVDWVVSAGLTHHLDDEQLASSIDEASRVARKGIVVVDAVLGRRLPGRMLWALDRGSFPRSREALREAVSARLAIVAERRFSVLHDYVVLEAAPG